MLEQVALAQQQRILFAHLFEFQFTAIFPLIIRGRVRIHSYHAALNQCRAITVPDSLDQGQNDLVNGLEPGTIQIIGRHSKTAGNPVNLRHCLLLLGHTDCITVVLDYKKNGQPFAGGPVERFEEFPLACSAFSGRDIDHLIASVHPDSFCHAYSRQELRTGTGRHGDEMQLP